MPKSVEHSGIYSTCRNAPTCTYLKDPKRTVLQCEEFEPYESPPRKKPEKNVPSSKRASFAADADEQSSAEYKGLCVDCENLESCTYPKPAGGVWHCEEYR